jgi:N-methylhydantoinase B
MSAISILYRTISAPWRLEHGRPAKPPRIVIDPGSESEQVKGGGLNQLASGEILVNDTGGGGGWGNPFDRDPAAVAADVRNGFVSVGAARADYGVIVDEQTFEVDAGATADARAAV